MENSWDVIIAGGGPAGLSAALMLGRARRRVLVIDAGSPRNRFAAHMHGVLGHEGRAPGELRERGRAEAASYGVEFADAEVVEVTRIPGAPEARPGLRVVDSDGGAHISRALVVATGLADDLPDVRGLAERWGTSVLHCPYCHGWEVAGQRLGVLTTSPLGMHQAELIRQWSDRVTVFTSGLGELSDETVRRFGARGVALESEPVAEVLGEGERIEAVRLRDGREVEIDALFTMGRLRPLDGFLAVLDLRRAQTPWGEALDVDQTGRTSDPRVWAFGNVVNPGATVPKSMGDASFSAGFLNGVLVAEDFDAAVAAEAGWPRIAEPGFWEERYAGRERVWSHEANAALRDVAAGLTPGSALDVGCGEGADAIWLAKRGWRATGIDVSATAVSRAADAAAAEGIGAERAAFAVTPVSEIPDGAFDLVTSSFLHSPAGLPREDILREAARKTAAGGHLLILSHAAPPSWAGADHAHAGHRFLPPREEYAALGLDPSEWEPVIVEARTRDVIGPDGEPGTIDDGVLLLRRR